MTGHEQPHDEFFPDFMVRFDGTQPEVSESERQDVSRDFTVFVNDLFSKHSSFTKRSETDHGDKYDTAQFLLNSDGQRWLVNCLSTAQESARSTEYNIPEKGIAIARIDESNEEQEEFQYNFRDGIVRRMDLGKPGGLYPDDESFDAAVETAVSAIEDALEGEELERSMGYYDQPIGTPELDGLKDLLDGGELTPVPLD